MSDPSLYDAAQEKLKTITAAHDWLEHNLDILGEIDPDAPSRAEGQFSAGTSSTPQAHQSVHSPHEGGYGHAQAPPARAGSGLVIFVPLAAAGLVLVAALALIAHVHSTPGYSSLVVPVASGAHTAAQGSTAQAPPSRQALTSSGGQTGANRRVAPTSSSPAAPDLSHLAPDEAQMIQDACNLERHTQGPASYYRCLNGQLAELRSSPGRPNLSRLSPDQVQMIDDACTLARYTEGPAAFYGCTARQVADLRSGPAPPDLSKVSRDEVLMIKEACILPRHTQGPAAYYRCIDRQLAKLHSDSH
jgi:hypothetical protein